MQTQTPGSSIAGLTGCVLLAAHGLAGAATLGAPVLESGLGESLRIILPVVPTGRDKLTVDCVKLRAGGELNDISNNVRADVVTTGERQAVVLTTVKPVNELVISVGVSLECGAFFLRRYTFLLDLPPAERRGSSAATQTVSPPGVFAEGTSAPPAATGASGLPGEVSAAKGVEAAAQTPRRRARNAQTAPNDAPRKSATRAGMGTSARATSVMRPEDEPGVLARSSSAAQAARAARAARAGRAPLAPPVRSMLKIELGGIDEFLASQPRLLLEQSTGMRLATDISAPDRQSSAAIAADRGFKQAHARYVAAMRDAPDPLTTENEALGKRLDGFSRDLASLKLDLQSTRARAEALEASRVPWWWLLIAAALAALLAGAGAAWWSRRGVGRPAGRLINLDGPRPGTVNKPFGTAPQEPAYQRDFTETVVMTRAERARRVARGEPDPGAEAVAAEVAGGADSAHAAPAGDAVPTPITAPMTASMAAAEAPRDTSEDLVSFNLPRFDKPTSAPPAVQQAIAAASTARAAAAATPVAAATSATPAPAIAPAPATLIKLDKNSLTQQLAAMEDLSDEAWASYRHPSDTSGVAVPFGATTTPAGPAAPINMIDDLQIDFSIDMEVKPLGAAAEAVPAAQPRDAGMISTSDISAMFAPPALDAAQSGIARVPNSALPLALTAKKDGDMFALDVLDAPAVLKATGTGSGITLAAMAPSAPDSAESEKMRDVMTAASEVMEKVHKLMQDGHPGGALRTLGIYLESAPPQAPPGPWIQLAHTLHEVGMRPEYLEAQELFRERFGADLPSWEAAYELKKHQMGMARVTGIEIMVAAGRGKPELIGRLAGLAYRVVVPAEVLFDVLLHRELLQQVAQTLIESEGAATADGGGVDISL